MTPEEYEAYLMQSELQKQASDANLTHYAPQLQEQFQQSQAILVEQTNPNKILNEIEAALKNQEIVDGEVKQVGEPLMNSRGIDKMKAFLRGIVNQNTILSHLDEKMIGRLMIKFGETLADDLALNWRKYEIREKTDLDIIMDIIMSNSLMALQRAWGQNEKNWLGKISVESISNGPKLSPKKQGIRDMFKL